MIPSFDQSGVLPPYLGARSTDRSNVSPYETTILELVSHYSFSAERVEILKGLLKYRKELALAGFVDGFQWIDGSFVEDCETLRQRAPSDIDLVSFVRRPTSISSDEEWSKFFPTVKQLFDPKHTKNEYMCDAYSVDLDIPSEHIVSSTSYWFGTFSHQRLTFQWKGMLRIPIYDKDLDKEASDFLNKVKFS